MKGGPQGQLGAVDLKALQTTSERLKKLVHRLQVGRGNDSSESSGGEHDDLRQLDPSGNTALADAEDGVGEDEIEAGFVSKAAQKSNLKRSDLKRLGLTTQMTRSGGLKVAVGSRGQSKGSSRRENSKGPSEDEKGESAAKEDSKKPEEKKRKKREKQDEDDEGFSDSSSSSSRRSRSSKSSAGSRTSNRSFLKFHLVDLQGPVDDGFNARAAQTQVQDLLESLRCDERVKSMDELNSWFQEAKMAAQENDKEMDEKEQRCVKVGEVMDVAHNDLNSAFTDRYSDTSQVMFRFQAHFMRFKPKEPSIPSDSELDDLGSLGDADDLGASEPGEGEGTLENRLRTEEEIQERKRAQLKKETARQVQQKERERLKEKRRKAKRTAETQAELLDTIRMQHEEIAYLKSYGNISTTRAETLKQALDFVKAEAKEREDTERGRRHSATGRRGSTQPPPDAIKELIEELQMAARVNVLTDLLDNDLPFLQKCAADNPGSVLDPLLDTEIMEEFQELQQESRKLDAELQATQKPEDRVLGLKTQLDAMMKRFERLQNRRGRGGALQASPKKGAGADGGDRGGSKDSAGSAPDMSWLAADAESLSLLEGLLQETDQAWEAFADGKASLEAAFGCAKEKAVFEAQMDAEDRANFTVNFDAGDEEEEVVEARQLLKESQERLRELKAEMATAEKAEADLKSKLKKNRSKKVKEEGKSAKELRRQAANTGKRINSRMAAGSRRGSVAESAAAESGEASREGSKGTTLTREVSAGSTVTSGSKEDGRSDAEISQELRAAKDKVKELLQRKDELELAISEIDPNAIASGESRPTTRGTGGAGSQGGTRPGTEEKSRTAKEQCEKPGSAEGKEGAGQEGQAGEGAKKEAAAKAEKPKKGKKRRDSSDLLDQPGGKKKKGPRAPKLGRNKAELDAVQPKDGQTKYMIWEDAVYIDEHLEKEANEILDLWDQIEAQREKIRKYQERIQQNKKLKHTVMEAEKALEQKKQKEIKQKTQAIEQPEENKIWRREVFKKQARMKEYRERWAKEKNELESKFANQGKAFERSHVESLIHMLISEHGGALLKREVVPLSKREPRRTAKAEQEKPPEEAPEEAPDDKKRDDAPFSMITSLFKGLGGSRVPAPKAPAPEAKKPEEQELPAQEREGTKKSTISQFNSFFPDHMDHQAAPALAGAGRPMAMGHVWSGRADDGKTREHLPVGVKSFNVDSSLVGKAVPKAAPAKALPEPKSVFRKERKGPKLKAAFHVGFGDAEDLEGVNTAVGLPGLPGEDEHENRRHQHAHFAPMSEPLHKPHTRKPVRRKGTPPPTQTGTSYAMVTNYGGHAQSRKGTPPPGKSEQPQASGGESSEGFSSSSEEEDKEAPQRGRTQTRNLEVPRPMDRSHSHGSGSRDHSAEARVREGAATLPPDSASSIAIHALRHELSLPTDSEDSDSTPADAESGSEASGESSQVSGAQSPRSRRVGRERRDSGRPSVGAGSARGRPSLGAGSAASYVMQQRDSLDSIY